MPTETVTLPKVVKLLEHTLRIGFVPIRTEIMERSDVGPGLYQLVQKNPEGLLLISRALTPEQLFHFLEGFGSGYSFDPTATNLRLTEAGAEAMSRSTGKLTANGGVELGPIDRA